MNAAFDWLIRFVGYEHRRSTLREQIVSGVGGLIAILAILVISRYFVAQDSGIIVASMGASAVLLFAVPHGPLSQPWQLLAGHLISALIGVSCAKFLNDPLIGGATAVGMAIFAMRIMGCIHPPGGATALSAVLGGQGVTDLGYQFVVTPVLLNAMVILGVAFAFNNLFHWRRYPLIFQPSDPKESALQRESQINHSDLVFALSEADTFLDISESDLLRVYEIALQHHSKSGKEIDRIEIGAFYSNGKYGADWQVREVLDIQTHGDEQRETVRFRIVGGAGRRRPGLVGLLEFSRWAKHRLERNENSWRRLE